MITETKEKILPLDLISISQLMNSNGDIVDHVSYRIENINENELKLIVQANHIEPDSIEISIDDSAILLSGDMNLFVDLIGNSDPIHLSKKVLTKIPMPRGIDKTAIYSKINDDNVTFFIKLI